MRKSTPEDKFYKTEVEGCYYVNPLKISDAACDLEFSFDKKTVYKLSPDGVDLTPEQFEIFSKAFPDEANCWWHRW